MKQNVKEIKNLVSKMVSLRQSKENSKECNKLQSLCIEKLEYIIDFRTRKYKGFANYEDLKQDARIALYLALQSYNPEKGDFFWWVNKYVKTKVSREANKHSTIKIPLKHAKNIQPYKVSQLPIITDDKTAFDLVSKRDNATSLRKAIGKLPTNQRKIIECHYDINSNINDPSAIDKISLMLNVNRTMCLKLLCEAKRNLKQNLIDMEI